MDLNIININEIEEQYQELILANQKLKNEIFVIVHGVGTGILRELTKNVLSKNRHVLEFKTYYYNNGCTIVRISLEK